MIYQVTFSKDGSGYDFDENIIVPDDASTIDDVLVVINQKFGSDYPELHLISGDMNEMSFCKRQADFFFRKVLTINKQ